MFKAIEDEIINAEGGTWRCSACLDMLDDDEENEYIARKPVCIPCWKDFCSNVEVLFDETDKID